MDIIRTMCGRFSLYASPAEIEAELEVEVDPPPPPRYNIAPGQQVLGVRLAKGARECASLRWGLVPAWATDPSGGTRLINARAETAAQKPSFREALKRRRCLLPANGFFEWTRETVKRPFYFARRDGRLCVLAGLWERWHGPEGVDLETCVVLTTVANATVAAVHERMPVILQREQFSRWLGGDIASAQALLGPAPEDLLASRAVGSWVNDPRREGEPCVAPDPGQGAELPAVEQDTRMRERR